MTEEAQIFNYFTAKVPFFKNVLLKPLKDDAGDLLQNELLNHEFITRAKWIIITDMVLNLKLSVDQVQDFLQHVNIQELLRG